MKCSTDFLKVILTAIVFFVVTFQFSCNNTTKTPAENTVALPKMTRGMDTAQHPWGSWNVVLNPSLNNSGKATALLDFENAILSAVRSDPRYSNYTINFKIFYCPCDSFLFNVRGTLLNGSGESAVIPAPPPPPNGSGDVQFASYNQKMTDLDDSIPRQLLLRDTSQKLVLRNASGRLDQDTSILAVIDTGLDPYYFPRELQGLLVNQSVYNVIDQSNTASYLDDHQYRHGTVVTALALQAVRDKNPVLAQATGRNAMPKLIVLKALDKNKQGTTFSVSCAMSYAIQKHASVINASLGYYDYHHTVDSVFRHYMQLANKNGIAVFAAAGNYFSQKDDAKICNDAAGTNLLNVNRMFYPACFSTEFKYLTTVTGTGSLHSSCFYQNYSPHYVTMAVKQINTGLCCQFSVPFAIGEGTSFATPVAAGTALSYLLNGKNLNDFMRSLQRESTLSGATISGQYMDYFSQ